MGSEMCIRDRNTAFFVPFALHASLQICYDLCADALPGFGYFGTQYSNEVRSISLYPAHYLLFVHLFHAHGECMQAGAWLQVGLSLMLGGVLQRPYSPCTVPLFPLTETVLVHREPPELCHVPPRRLHVDMHGLPRRDLR